MRISDWSSDVCSSDLEQGGSDVKPLGALGVPLLAPRQDATRYFDIHHATTDTLDHLDHAGLRQNVAVYATSAWLAANWPGPLGRLEPVAVQSTRRSTPADCNQPW